MWPLPSFTWESITSPLPEVSAYPVTDEMVAANEAIWPGFTDQYETALAEEREAFSAALFHIAQENGLEYLYYQDSLEV